MQKQSKNNVKHLKTMSDEEIKLDDIPEQDDEFFKSAQVKLPSKQSVTIRMDSDVLLWFKKQGRGYQTRINKLLRRYMETHQS
jgi:uncharacterized protein (DUF4415 family)